MHKTQIDLQKYYILALVLLAFALRLYRLDFQSIWWDEGHSIQMASAPIAQIPTLPGMDVHPPGFFATLHIWMAMAGKSEFALRYLSVIFSMLTLALLMRFGKRWGGAKTMLATGALLAFSPMFVTYAQEIRMYSMVTFFAAASLFFWWQIVFPPRTRIQNGKNKILALYILSTAAAFYTHYFTLFLLLFQNLFWLGSIIFQWRKGDAKARISIWIASQLGIVILFLSQLWLASKQISGYANPNLRPPALSHFIAQSWQAYTLGLNFDSVSAIPFLWILAATAGIGILFLPTAKIRARTGILLSAFLIPVAFYFIVLQIRPSFEPRYLMLVTPALFLALGMIFSQNRLSFLLNIIVLIIFVIALKSYFFDENYFKDDSAGVANWLAAETTAADIVLVDVPHPFHYYAERIPAQTDYLFVDVHTAADTLNQMALGKNRLFWVTWRESDTDPRGIIPFLVQKQAGAPRGEKQFRGYHIEWYTLSDKKFSLPNDLPSADVNFDNVLKLDALAFSEKLSAGETAWATVHISQLAETDLNYKLSLRLRVDDGRVLAQRDKLILNDRHFQTAAWVLDDPALNQTINVFTLPLTDPDFSGTLTLEAVVYNAANGDAIAAYGVPTTNGDFVSAQIGTLEVIAP